MLFMLENLLIGIISGIISGILVSRIFLLQGEYQNQIAFFESLLNKLRYAKVSLEMCRKILELKYDTQETAKKETIENKYASVNQYYAIHGDQDWISASDTINVIIQQMNEYFDRNKSIKMVTGSSEKELEVLCDNANSVLNKIQKMKEYSFSNINENIGEIDTIEKKYKEYSKGTNRKLMRIFFKDRIVIGIMLLLFIVLISYIIVRL